MVIGWVRFATTCGYASLLVPGLPKQHLITEALVKFEKSFAALKLGYEIPATVRHET